MTEFRCKECGEWITDEEPHMTEIGEVCSECMSYGEVKDD